MNIEQTYISLRKHYGTKHDGESFSITLEELADVLKCTRRNAQLLIQKMQQCQLIIWHPGKGRGHLSKMTFIQPLHDLILEKAKKLVIEEGLGEAWRLIDELPILKFDFTEWLYRHLGFLHTDEEDILRFPFYRPVLDLDPTFVHRRTEAHLIEQLFDTLVRYDEKNKEIVPLIAYYWESNEEKTVWRFFLRKGIRFHHGKVLTSKDVIFTFQRILTQSNFEDIKSSIKDMKMIGNTIVEFTLHEPNVLFIHYLCSERCSILPHDLEEIKGSQNFSAMPIGTGPFRMKKNNESALLLEANDNYFKGRPHLDGIEMWIWPNYDETKMMRKLEEDQFYIGDFPGNQQPQANLVSLEKGATYLSFNLQKDSPMKNLLFRKAVHYGIDRQRMVEELGEERSKPSCSFFPEYSQEYFQNDFNLDLARILLNKSSYSGESLKLFTYEMMSNEQNAYWIQKELNKMGIKVAIHIVPIQDMMDRNVLHEADMIVAGEVLARLPDIELLKMFSYQNSFIVNHLGEKERGKAGEYLSLCKLEASSNKRIQHLISLQEELEKTVPFLFLYHTKQSIKHSYSLQGAVLNGWGKVDYKDIWIKRF